MRDVDSVDGHVLTSSLEVEFYGNLRSLPSSFKQGLVVINPFVVIYRLGQNIASSPQVSLRLKLSFRCAKGLQELACKQLIGCVCNKPPLFGKASFVY